MSRATTPPEQLFGIPAGWSKATAEGMNRALRTAEAVMIAGADGWKLARVKRIIDKPGSVSPMLVSVVMDGSGGRLELTARQAAVSLLIQEQDDSVRRATHPMVESNRR